MLSKRLSSIKRNFLSSPFEMMLEAVRVNAQEKGNVQVPNFSFCFKPDRKEKIWLAFESTPRIRQRTSSQCTSDSASKTGSSSSWGASSSQYGQPHPGTSRRQEARAQLPGCAGERVLAAATAGGELPAVEAQQVQLRQRHRDLQYKMPHSAIFGPLVRNQRSMAWYLANFRNYAYYHIQAWKCYLHSRTLRRLNIFQRVPNA